jgi:hypothetical protein
MFEARVADLEALARQQGLYFFQRSSRPYLRRARWCRRGLAAAALQLRRVVLSFRKSVTTCSISNTWAVAQPISIARIPVICSTTSLNRGSTCALADQRYPGLGDYPKGL